MLSIIGKDYEPPLKFIIGDPVKFDIGLATRGREFKSRLSHGSLYVLTISSGIGPLI